MCKFLKNSKNDWVRLHVGMWQAFLTWWDPWTNPSSFNAIISFRFNIQEKTVPTKFIQLFHFGCPQFVVACGALQFVDYPDHLLFVLNSCLLLSLVWSVTGSFVLKHQNIFTLKIFYFRITDTQIISEWKS